MRDSRWRKCRLLRARWAMNRTCGSERPGLFSRCPGGSGFGVQLTRSFSSRCSGYGIRAKSDSVATMPVADAILALSVLEVLVPLWTFAHMVLIVSDVWSDSRNLPSRQERERGAGDCLPRTVSFRHALVYKTQWKVSSSKLCYFNISLGSQRDDDDDESYRDCNWAT